MHELFALLKRHHAEVLALLNQILDKENIMATTTAQLLAEATAQTSIVASVQSAISALQAAVSAVPGLTAQQQSDIDAAFAALTNNDAALAKAIAANTPVTPAQVTATK